MPWLMAPGFRGDPAGGESRVIEARPEMMQHKFNVQGRIQGPVESAKIQTWVVGSNFENYSGQNDVMAPYVFRSEVGRRNESPHTKAPSSTKPRVCPAQVDFPALLPDATRRKDGTGGSACFCNIFALRRLCQNETITCYVSSIP